MNLVEGFCKLTQDIGKAVTKRTPEILAGFGIASFITSTVSAVYATPTAVKKLEEKKKELKVEKLPLKETVKTIGPDYAVSAVSCVAGIGCVCASVNSSNNRYIALSTSYSLLDDFTRTYINKTKEIVGKSKEEKIRDAVNQERIDKNVPTQSVNIYAPKEDGTYRCLFYEPITNRYFWERREKVEISIAKAYKEIESSFEEELSVYTWLSLLPQELRDGLPDGSLDKYMDMGWSRTTPYDGLTIEIKSGGVVHGGQYDGYPCLVLEYSELPVPYFRAPY